MTQPVWKTIANLGDADPVDHGGYFVMVDETGVYPPEVEVLVEPCEEWLQNDGTETDCIPKDEGQWTVYRFILEPCTFADGILSDNPYHPASAAWFAKPESKRAERPQDTTYLANLCRCCGISEKELISYFCSDDPIQRALAWRNVGMYHGWYELDQYPLTLSREEVCKRYEIDE